MTETVIVALIALAGTIFSGVVSAIMTNRVTVYRLEALTKEVEKHNKVIERTFKLEQKVEDMDEKVEDHDARIKNIENKK